MVDVVLFHHVLGLTEGVRELAERLRAGGRHSVTTPDLFDGRTFSSIEDGFAAFSAIAEDEVLARAARAVAQVPRPVYAGISLGVMAAQRVLQERGDARGALFLEGALPVSGEWATGPWPTGVPVQIHGMDDDEFFTHEGDIDAARAIVSSVGPDSGELFTYPGNAHLFTDSSSAGFDADATRLVVERAVAFLDGLGPAA
ncbi:dienelactone hydrolase family protein [Georgenia sp. Z1491]|uniref:dienelactone hydrolase family protein n=1 Tax=Georgenia sp. Z1491 TaxID=3416707 RepID=UPI003CF876C5